MGGSYLMCCVVLCTLCCDQWHRPVAWQGMIAWQGMKMAKLKSAAKYYYY